MSSTLFNHFLPAIKKLPIHQKLTREDILTDQLLIDSEKTIKMYYAPHNEPINTESKIVIVGITPGFNQMKVAYEQFLESFASNLDLKTCLYNSKEAAGFAGSMRTNLINMLNQCGLSQALSLGDTSDLFNQRRTLLHTTSIIKYPVFVNTKNYTGHQPQINHSPLLQHYAFNVFPKELHQISDPALIIPLGEIAEQIVLNLKEENQLSNHWYLTGFPHPSGANGHRLKQFNHEKVQLQNQIKRWFKI